MADGITGITAAAPIQPTEPAQDQAIPTPDPVEEAGRVGGPLGAAAVSALGAAAKHQNTPDTQTPAPSAPPQPSGKTIKMSNPKGELGDVPEERAAEAAKSGYKPVTQMTNPKGEVGYVPTDRSHEALAAGYKFGAPIKDTSSISAAPTISGGDIAGALVNTNSLNKVNKAIDDAISSIENYSQEGRQEHPVLAQVGDLVRSAKNLLFGGQSAGNPFGTSSGMLNNPVSQAIMVAPDAAALGQTAEEEILPQLKKGATKVGDVMEDMFRHAPETPEPQHGTPVKVDSPLDRATVNKLPGGKELSDEAFSTLQKHVGDTIPQGSSSKNMMMKAVKPVLRTIDDAGSQLTKVIDQAPAFQTSLMDDAKATQPFLSQGASQNVAAAQQESGVLQDIADIRDNLPLKAEDPLNKVVDKQVESYQEALNSKDPKELLSARRKLGNTIDWANITFNPESAGEVANTTKVKLYHAMGNKLKTIDQVADLDKVLQPNLELRSHMDAKLGKAVSRDPVEAEAQQVSEHRKGIQTLENQEHNEKVNRNIRIAMGALKTAGVLGAGTLLGAEALKHYSNPTP